VRSADHPFGSPLEIADREPRDRRRAGGLPGAFSHGRVQTRWSTPIDINFSLKTVDDIMNFCRGLVFPIGIS
jgi:hypothetical protein